MKNTQLFLYNFFMRDYCCMTLGYSTMVHRTFGVICHVLYSEIAFSDLLAEYFADYGKHTQLKMYRLI